MLRGLALAAAVAALAASAVAAAPRTSAAGCTKVARPAPKPNGGYKKPMIKLLRRKHYDVTFTTNCGSFTIRLAVGISPHTTASFFTLAKTGFFDHTFFHRIIPGFVIQGGDPTGTGTGGPGYAVVDRPPPATVYRKYLAAMAKTQFDPSGTAGSQFFVDTADVQLPPEYAVLGTVFVGRKIVDRIGRLGTPSGKPTQIVEILRTKVSIR